MFWSLTSSTRCTSTATFLMSTGLEPNSARMTSLIRSACCVQGERHILELNFRHPGKFMFHAHQSEFAELGWMGFFEVKG